MFTEDVAIFESESFVSATGETQFADEADIEDFDEVGEDD